VDLAPQSVPPEAGVALVRLWKRQPAPRVYPAIGSLGLARRAIAHQTDRSTCALNAERPRRGRGNAAIERAGGEVGVPPPRSTALWSAALRSAATPAISAVSSEMARAARVQVYWGGAPLLPAVVVVMHPWCEERAGMEETTARGIACLPEC